MLYMSDATSAPFEGHIASLTKVRKPDYFPLNFGGLYSYVYDAGGTFCVCTDKRFDLTGEVKGR